MNEPSMPVRSPTQTRNQRDAPAVDVVDMAANTSDEIASEDDAEDEGVMNEAGGEEEEEIEEEEEEDEEEEDDDVQGETFSPNFTFRSADTFSL
jgi:hypothetical protein